MHFFPFHNNPKSKPLSQRSINEPNLANSLASLFSNSDAGPSKSLVEGWDIVEHPKFPPPPSQNEDVEHWTRAMFIDATTK